MLNRVRANLQGQRKFKLLMDMLGDNQPPEMKLAALIFINTLVNTCDAFERRVLLRRELLDLHCEPARASGR